jgi:hypothetical protein
VNVDNGDYDNYVEIIAMNEICKLSIGVYFVSEVQITQPPNVIGGQVLTEKMFLS